MNSLLGWFGNQSMDQYDGKFSPDQIQKIDDAQQVEKDKFMVWLMESLSEAGGGYGSVELTRYIMYLRGDNLYPMFNKYGSESSYSPTKDLIMGSFSFIMDSGLGGELLDGVFGTFFTKNVFKEVPSSINFSDEISSTIYTKVSGEMRPVIFGSRGGLKYTTSGGKLRSFTLTQRKVYGQYMSNTLYSDFLTASYIFDWAKTSYNALNSK